MNSRDQNASLLGAEMALLAGLSSFVAGVVAALLVMLSSYMDVQSDMLLSGLLFVAAAACISKRKLVRAGVLSGLSILSNPSCAPALLVLGIPKGNGFAWASSYSPF